MKKIVVVGGGGHAKSVINILKKLSGFALLGYTDPRDREKILGVNYLGNDDVLERIVKNHRGCAAAIGIGSVHADRHRESIMKRLEAFGFDLPSIVSPDATVSRHVTLGKAAIVFDGAVVNAGAKIGRAAIINTNSTVEHDCQIGDYVHIAPGATLGGGVHVGDFSLVGTGASVRQSITVGKGCCIGVGAAVVEDCLEPGTYVGVPARFKKQ